MVYKTIWRLPEVQARTGLSRSSIYDKMSKGEFPLSINLGLRAVGWDSDDINGWIQRRIDDSRRDD
jgi:prophage regulatory protein